MAGTRRLLFRNIRAIYVQRFVGLVTSFVLVPILIDRIGLADFGLWVLATAVFGYAGLLELGISNTVTRFVANRHGGGDEAGLSRILSSSFTFSLIAGCVAAGVLAGFSIFGEVLLHLDATQLALHRTVFGILSVRALFAFALALPEAILKGFERYSIPAGVGVATSVLNFVVTLWLVGAGYGIVELALLSVLLPGIAATCNAAFVRRAAPSISLNITRHPLRDTPDVFKFAGGWATISITSAMMYQANFMVVGAILSTAAVGVYAIIGKTNQLIREFEWLTVQAVTPLAARLQAQGHSEKRNDLVALGTRYLTAVEFTTVATLVALFPAFLLVWVGPAFESWAWMGQLYLAYFLLTACLTVATQTLVGEARLRPVVSLTLVLGLLNLTLSVVLTLFFSSILGVVLGTVISFLAVFPWWITLYAKALQTSRAALIAPAIPSYVSAGVALLVGVALLRTGAVTTLSAFVVSSLLAFGAGIGVYWALFITKEERKLLLAQIDWNRKPIE